MTYDPVYYGYYFTYNFGYQLITVINTHMVVHITSVITLEIALHKSSRGQGIQLHIVSVMVGNILHSCRKLLVRVSSIFLYCFAYLRHRIIGLNVK